MGIVDDPSADMVSPATLKRAAQDAIRLAGVRDILVAGHPEVDRQIERLAADRHRVPAADPEIIEKLAALDGFAFDGTIATIDGVPLPAGEWQTNYFMVLRYWPLYAPGTLAHLVYLRNVSEIGEADHEALGIGQGQAPDLVHLLAYDAAHVTDDMQETLLSYSTATHRDNLVVLQRHCPALYVALWRRDMEAAKRLVRRLRNAALPASSPKSRVRSHALRLLYGTSLMNEDERLFEIIGAVRASHGVTRQSLASALRSSTSMSAVWAVGDDTQEFLAGSVAHVRSMHRTMNAVSTTPRTTDLILERSRTAHANTRAFCERVRRIRWIAGAMPAASFCGVEPAFLAPVALIQMIANMTRREGEFWLRGKPGQAADVDEARRSLAIRLGVVITSGICAATARSMLPENEVDEKLGQAGLRRSDEAWRDAVVPTLIFNPLIAEKVEKRLQHLHNLGGDLPEVDTNDEGRPCHSSPYDRAMERTRAFFEIGQPGWTQGFFFEAWLRPDAEIAFLLNCCRYIQYSPDEGRKRMAVDAALGQARFPDGTPVTSTDIDTGLPRQHPLGRIQDLFRPQFDQLQVAELVPEHWTSDQRKRREFFVREAAPLFAAVSAITVDPQRVEWWWKDLDLNLKRVAAEGAWNTS